MMMSRLLSNAPAGLLAGGDPVIGRNRLRLAVTLGTALVLLILAAVTGLSLARSWQAAHNAAERSLQRVTQVVENTINRQMLQVDGALASLPALLAATDASGDATILITPQSAARLLRGFNFQTFAFRDLMLLRPDGSVWASARPMNKARPLPLDLTDLSGGHKIAANTLQGPLRNAATGDWAVYLVRSVTLPGVGELWAAAEVPLPLLAHLLSDAGAVPDMRIVLARQNGQLIASMPQAEPEIGKIQAPAPEDVRTDGTAFEVPASAKRPAAIAMARPTLYDDIVVMASIEMPKVMAEWTRERDRLLGGVAIAALLILGAAAALLIALRQHERLEAERNHSGTVLGNAIEAMADGFVMWDAEDRLVTCNQRYRELYSLSAPFIYPGARFEDIIRRGAERGQYPEAGNDIEPFVQESIRWHRHNSGTLERLLPGGQWLLVTERRMEDGGVVGIRTDITQLKNALADLATANERAGDAMEALQEQNLVLLERDRAIKTRNTLFEAALDNMSHGLLMCDAGGHLIVCNRRFMELFGLGGDQAQPGIPVQDLAARVKERGLFDAEAIDKIEREQRALAEEGRSKAFVVITTEGRAISIAQEPMRDGGWVATYEDVTRQHRAETRIRFLAHHDELTRLSNRVLFRSRIEEALQALRGRKGCLALLYLDLDKFKDVNDTLGHPIGDALLQAVARRLRSCLRQHDIVARLGGDEFAVACLSPESPDPAIQLSRRIIERLSAPYQIMGRTVTVGVSVGIAIAVESDVNADTLLKNADMALYQAKANGRGTCCVFEPEMEARLRARLEIEADLRAGLELGQFEIAYQPLINLEHDTVCGFEALLRWHHPVRGFISPAEFIPLAEETGLIVPVGSWVLRTACAEIAALPGNARVAVNLSPVQLKSDGIVETVAGALAASGLDASRLELEITESALLEDDERTVAILEELRGLGLRIVLDDFGTGYSSLSHLRRFPLSKIKIDQSFIREMTTRADCAAIVSSVVSLADKLGMSATAEGVETIDQLNFIRAVGCCEAQGYLLGRPMPFLNAMQFMGSHTPAHVPRSLLVASATSA